MKEEAWNWGKKAFEIEANAIQNAALSINKESFAKAVDLLSNATRIGTSACGHSGIACQHFAHLMCCVERPSRFISPAEAVHGAMGFLQEGDVMLLASRGGKTAELLPILEICKKKNVKLIGVTENEQAPLAQDVDVWLKMAITKETDPYNAQGTTSFVVLSAIFDALQAGVIIETGYQGEQFALIHPGGAVGERLNKKQILK